MNLLGVHLDPVAVVAVVLSSALWALVGFELCRVTHKQRGLEVDRPVTDALPPLPDWVHGSAPDYIPEDWTREDA